MLAAFAILALAAQEPAGPIVVHNKPAFHLRLPAGYEPLKPAPKNVTYGYLRPLSTTSTETLVLGVTVLGGWIDRKRPSEAEAAEALAAAKSRLPADAQIRIIQESWGEFQVDVFETRTTVNGRPTYTVAAQLPTVPTSVQIQITAPLEAEEEARKDLRAMLGTFSAKSNWQTKRERRLAFGASVPRAAGWTLVILYCISHVLWFRRGGLASFRLSWLALILVLFVVSGICTSMYSSSRTGESSFSVLSLLGVLFVLVYGFRVLREDAV